MINQTHIKQFILPVLLVLLIVVSQHLFGHLSLAEIKHNKDQIQFLIENHYALSIACFYITCIIFINSPIPVAALIKVLGGFFYGVYLGSLFNITATLLACLVGFSLSRYIFKKPFEARYKSYLNKIEHEIKTNGFYYFFILRIIMVVPYFLINIVAGLSVISFKTFFYSTLLGVIPASIVYANGGSHLERINSIEDLFSPKFIFSVALIAFFTMIPTIRKKFLH